MKHLIKIKKEILLMLLSGLVISAAGALYSPQKSSAIGLCSAVGDPWIKITISGQTFTSNNTGDGSITVSPGSQVPFTVWTYAEPSSVNYISYPGGSNSYPGPCGHMCSSGRSYTTSAMNSPGDINVSIAQNCQDDGVPPGEASLSISLNLPPCSINSFTCSSNDTLSWSTSNCSSRSISPTIGSVGATGSTQGAAGTAYILTAGSNTSSAYCPASTLSASWSESGGTTISKTVSAGSNVTIPFTFSNSGDSGSTIQIIGCDRSSSWATRPECSGTLTVP